MPYLFPVPSDLQAHCGRVLEHADIADLADYEIALIERIAFAYVAPIIAILACQWLVEGFYV